MGGRRVSGGAWLFRAACVAPSWELVGSVRLRWAWLSGWPLSRGEPLEPDMKASAAASGMPLDHQGSPLRQPSSALQQQGGEGAEGLVGMVHRKA